ncbi:MAG TPA: hypothetical protein VGU44_06345 [Gammaproteobacteria bacterium]|nr:hypothetical protein [Gammaproteobacteria bacterium]
MKGILKFDLTDPDEKRKFELALKAEDYQLFIWNFSQNVLRKYYKYELPDELKNGESLIKHIYDEFYQLFNEYNLVEPT